MKKWILWGSLVIFLVAIVFFLYTQTQPTITKTVQVTLNVVAKPDFTLAVVPDVGNTFVGRTIPFLAEVTADANFSGEVVVSVSGLPAGITAAFFPGDTMTVGAGETKSIQIDVTVADDDTLVGAHVFTVTAESDTYN